MSVNGTPAVSSISGRGPPRTAEYQFEFRVPNTLDIVDTTTNKKVVWYEYEIKIRRRDVSTGAMRVHTFGGGSDARFRKRWSEIDRFDKEWSDRIAQQIKDGDTSGANGGGSWNELRLDPFRLNKMSGPLLPVASVKAKRQARFTDYMMALMSEPKLYPMLAKFLSIPLEMLAPPVSASPSPPTASSPETILGEEEEDQPLQYTKRKIKRRAKPTRTDGDSDDDDVEGDVAAAGSAAFSSAGSPVPSASSGVRSAKGASQFKKDGVTPNSNWVGPPAEDWNKMAECTFFKLPHSTGFLHNSKPKPRTFQLIPITNERAQVKLKQANKDKRAVGVLDHLSPDAFLFTWDSHKDVFDSIFILGDSTLPWSVIFDQSAGHWAKQKKGPDGRGIYADQENLSLTVTFREGDDMKTLDLVAVNQEEYQTLKRALTYIQWREQGKVKTKPIITPTPEATNKAP